MSHQRPWIPMLLLAALVAGCNGGPERPDIPFAESLGDPPDFAAVEAGYPLTDAHRQALTPENLTTFDQDELDQIYARLDPGPIPDGPYMGSIIFAEGGGPKKLAERIGRIAEGVADVKLDKLEFLGERLWKGKVFFRDQRLLRNQIDHEGVVADLFDVPEADLITEEIGGRRVALLFPAALYCGESYLDPRRESVIIDYADTAQLPGYIEKIDSLAGKDKLRVRDEIRLIRPGLYLGRAYLREKFALTFILHNVEVEASGVVAGEPCWDGRSPRPEPEPPTEETMEEAGEAAAGEEPAGES